MKNFAYQEERGWPAMRPWEKRTVNLWNSTPVAVLLAVCGTIVAVWAAITGPSPGVSIGLLGAGAALMSLRTEMRPLEKVAWIVIITILATTEIIAINKGDEANLRARKDQNDRFDKEEKKLDQLREQQKEEFNKTAEGLKAAIDKSNRIFARTEQGFQAVIKREQDIANVSNSALGQITGGDQYCYLEALFGGGGSAQLAVMNSGPLPLQRCHIVLSEIKTTPPVTPQDWDNLMRPLVIRELGPLSPGKKGVMTDIVLGGGTYYVQIQTRNAEFYEFLVIHGDFPNPQKKEGLATVEVRDSQWKLVYSSPQN
ncbi:MAG TPA: hypothetical protein VN982_07665 [Candidatus Dormibacteraeota bacterium]|nr:hypothetical protein [Candidatus Dormibacteraeota bacterium]